jgi:hypothetical protein
MYVHFVVGMCHGIITSVIALLQLYGLGTCVRSEDGSLKGTETCRPHRCYKFVQ